VEGRLRDDATHFTALAQCFPGGSVTGAPKIRAMEIIDELEPVTRRPLHRMSWLSWFNRESQLSIIIRAAFAKPAGITSMPVLASSPTPSRGRIRGNPCQSRRLSRAQRNTSPKNCFIASQERLSAFSL